jgi:hypothetical protein
LQSVLLQELSSKTDIIMGSKILIN